MQVVSLPARIGALAIRLRNSSLRAYVPYAAVGTVTCIVAILVAEIFVQAMQPPPVEVDPNDPLVIALLIDTSSSMEGEPIAEVRDASIRFLETWDRSNTHVAVIPFNTYAIVHPILAKEKPADPLIPELRGLEAVGGTAMLLGLQKAQEAFDSIDSSRNAVMLFTDGMPNRPGPTQRLATEMRGHGTVIVAIGSAGANYGYLEQLTGHPDNVFTTRLGDFASAFDRAAQVIAASSFGTATTSQGLTVVFVVSLFLAAAMLATENMWGLRGNWWRDMWWLPVAGGIAGYVGGLVGEYVLRLGIVTWGLVGLSCGAALGLTDLVGDQFTGLRSLLRIPPKSRRGCHFRIDRRSGGRNRLCIVLPQCQLGFHWRRTAGPVLASGGFCHPGARDWLGHQGWAGTTEEYLAAGSLQGLLRRQAVHSGQVLGLGGSFRQQRHQPEPGDGHWGPCRAL